MDLFDVIAAGVMGLGAKLDSGNRVLDVAIVVALVGAILWFSDRRAKRH